MAELIYTDQHEWLSVDGDVALIGITNYAQEQLGDVVYVELPKEGAEFNQGDEAAVVESVKAASEVFAPVNGVIVEVNPDLEDDPSLVNSGPESEGWFFKLKLSDVAELETLMSKAAYDEYVADLG